MKKIHVTKWRLALLVASFAIVAMSQSVSADFWSDLMEEDDKTSFTKFEGKFETPDSKFYPDELTKTKNLREYVLQITNFALSFLGLAAVIAVIYGGLLYVTSGGADEKTGEGKKTIQYALGGLIIIIVSYALVNTVIEGASTGREPDGSVTGTVDSSGGSVIPVGAVSGIADIQEGVEAAYLSYTEKADMVTKTADFIEGKIDSEADYANNISTFKSILNDIKDAVKDISKGTGDLSETTETATEIINEIDQKLAKNAGTIDVAAIMQADVLLAAKSCPSDSYNITLCDLIEKVEGLADTIEEDFTNLINDFADALEELGENYAGLAIEVSFGIAVRNIESLSINSSNNDVRKVTEYLTDVAKAAGEISSVQAVITATSAKGNAPLTVYFDSFKSVDPAGAIADDKNKWDLNGDGKYASSTQTDCQEVKASRVSCTYKEAGTYTVGLTIESSDAQTVVPGLASIPIIVEPARSKIVLIGKTTTGAEVTITDYRQDPQVNMSDWEIIDVASWKISETEAKNGITLDASNTRDGDGNSMKSFTWNFGDGSKPIVEGSGIQTYKYGKVGQYTFELEVEDLLGNKDRKILTIYVGSPVARIAVSPETGNIETDFLFDAGESQADEAQIINFEWTFTENANKVTKNEESFSYTFKTPGTYAVKLKVEDSSGESNETTQEVKVSSREPVAIIDSKIREPYEPAVLELSAKRSYDEDAGDSIKKYLWDITSSATNTADVQFVENTNKNSASPVIQFAETGTKEVTLTVEDNFGAKKSVTQKIEIRSILDVSLTIGSADSAKEKLVYQLVTDASTGQLGAVVDFYPSSAKAKAFEIQFGDAENDFVEMGTVSISHTYTEEGSYAVKLIASDGENNENSVIKKIAVTSGENPVALMTVTKDGEEVAEEGAEAYRTSVLEFDAEQSVGKSGEKTNLSYLWKFSAVDPACVKTDIGSGATVSRQKTDRRSFQDIGCYLVKLTVSDGSVTDESDVFRVKIIPALPTFDTITIDPQSSDMETPLKVTLKAIGALDPDGEIIQYKWWYYPKGFGSQQSYEKGIQLGSGSSATLTINTHDDFDTDRNGKIEYGFALEVKDADGNAFTRDSDTGGLPTLEVVNGENEDPEVKLRADRTSIYVNEYVTFTAEAEDPDGSIVKYEWDLNGDGAFQEGSNTKTLTYQFTAEATKGIPIRVRVYDDRGAFASSSSVTVYVDKKN